MATEPQRTAPASPRRPPAVGPWVCVVNAVIAVGLLAWVLGSVPELAANESIAESPWIGTWMRGAAVTAMLLPVSTLFLWRSCPPVELPRSRWPQGDATPLRRRFVRLAPKRGKLAVGALALHGLVLVAFPVVAMLVAA